MSDEPGHLLTTPFRLRLIMMKQAAALATDPGQPLGCAHRRLVLDKLDPTIQDDSNRNNGAKHELCDVYGE